MRSMRTVSLVASLTVFLSAGVVLELVVAQDGRAAQPTPLWTRQFGAGPSFATSAQSVVVGGEARVYVTGTTRGALPGQSHAGGSDAFIRIYDGAGSTDEVAAISP
jgi:hypothetical protein